MYLPAEHETHHTYFAVLLAPHRFAPFGQPSGVAPSKRQRMHVDPPVEVSADFDTESAGSSSPR